MKLRDLKSSDNMTFQGIACRLLVPRRILSTEGRIQRAGDGYFKLIMKDEDTYTFQIENIAEEHAITSHIEQRQQNLVEVVTMPHGETEANKGLFYLHIVFFGLAQRIHQNITLDDNIKSQLLKMHLGRDAREIENAVKRNFCLNNGTQTCYAITIGKYNPEEFASDSVSDSEEWNTENDMDTEKTLDITSELESSAQENEKKSIVIYGADFSIQVRVQGCKGEEFLRAVRIDKKNRHRPQMILAIGELNFCDQKNFIEKQLREQLSAVHGYLDLWSRYTSAEGDFLFRRVRTVGGFHIRANTYAAQNGIEVYADGLTSAGWEQLKKNEELLFTAEMPVYLQSDMTWDEYQAYLQDIRAAKKEAGMDIMVSADKGKTFKILDVRPQENCIVLENNQYEEMPEGIASLSIAGYKTQIERREAAKNMIDNGQSENPGLGLIIEGKLPNILDDIGAHKKIEPLSALVREKIFSHDPTTTQQDAISIALNTPDIAIIQGPPGTGKTTVITAIIERLNELADHSKESQGSVLVTSFQHDAVRNVINRLRINSLPTIKFGRQGEMDQTAEQLLDEWCMEYTEKLKEINPGIRESKEQKKLSKLRAVYIAYPSNENAHAILQFAKDSVFGNLFGQEIDELSAQLQEDSDRTADRLIPKIRRLRLSKESFLDDGRDTAYDLLCDLESKLGQEKSRTAERVIEILDRAANGDDEPDEKFLQDMRFAQQELLKNFVKAPSYQEEKPRKEILDLCEELEKHFQRPLAEKDRILAGMLSELENNPERVRDTVAAYNFVYAATTQQSEGSDIRRAKKLTHREDHPSYDTVVIDEAARVNPGDLMIPMTQARRRIILVGDHRQLPHIYDEEIFESMQTDGMAIDKSVVKESMFQYLMQKAKELTAQDYIPRTITLNAQYRMHPMLGKFVSRNFYDQYNEGFQSPRPASDFDQALWPKPIKWVNFPGNIERARKIGTSRVRLCEAEYIADTLKKYTEMPEGQSLSYGVITFYSGQRDLISRKLKEKLGDRADEIRVGSVDAFQGMEFDVIFLSVVRCQTGDITEACSKLEQDSSLCGEQNGEFQNWSEIRQKIGLKYYGFLVSENRLCVALSRQKKLLIVVGDAGAFTEGEWGRVAQDCVPAMKNLVELCRDEGVLIDGKT